MSATKLTLRLNKTVIEEGKAYAKAQETSLSKLFEAFLKQKIGEYRRQKPYEHLSADEFLNAIRPDQPFIDAALSDTELKEQYYDYVADKGNN